MKPLFSAEGTACLDAIVRPGVLCVFDFDGTLAPIVAQPDDAHLPAPVRERLQTLQQHVPVAILTGRALRDIGSRLDFNADYTIGNHGLEGLPDSTDRRSAYSQVCSAWRGTVQAALADANRFEPTLLLEDKEISLSLHYRHARNQAAARQQLLALFATLSPPPRVIAGKCVYNLLPQGSGDKGTAFKQLMQLSGATSAIYVGDDVTDEDVFALARDDLLSVRVGQTTGSAAPFFLRRHADILRLLDDLAARLKASEISHAAETALPAAAASNSATSLTTHAKDHS
ncbi:MAG: trehalose-phosphatase [Herminiimonas sp.]|nr:trehalose-phosphatase [Herminiimonas sp.]